MKESKRVRLAKKWRGVHQLRHGQRRSNLPVCRVCRQPLEAGKLAEHSSCVALQLAQRREGKRA
jgi:hypothetical protein